MSILDSRIAFKPFEYPEIEQFAEVIQKTYWIASEIDFTIDIQNFKIDLNDTERYIIGTILKTFAQTEVFVADEFWSQVSKYLPKPEIALVSSTFTENEWRHAVAYDKLNEVLGLTDYDTFLKDGVAIERFENLCKIRQENEGKYSKTDIARSLALFSAFTENVNLFSQFAIMRSFSSNGRNLLPNIANIIDWSQSDERIHAQCGIYLFNKLIDEYPEIFNDEFKADIYIAAKITFDIEKKLIDQIFAQGELINLSKNQLINFMKDRLNQSLKELRLKPIFEVDNELLKQMQWFYDETDAQHHADFFFSRPTEYSKKLVSFNKDSVKVTKEEITSLL